MTEGRRAPTACARADLQGLTHRPCGSQATVTARLWVPGRQTDTARTAESSAGGSIQRVVVQRLTRPEGRRAEEVVAAAEETLEVATSEEVEETA